MQGFNNFPNLSSLYQDAVKVAVNNPLTAGGKFTIRAFNKVISATAPIIPSNTILYGYVNLAWFLAGAGLADLVFQIGTLGDSSYQGFVESFGGRLVLNQYIGAVGLNNVIFSGGTQVYISVNGYQINFT